MTTSCRIAPALTAAALAVGSLVVAAPPSQAAEARVVCADVLRVRTKPTSASRTVDYLRRGSVVSATPVRGTTFVQIGSGRYVGGKFLCARPAGKRVATARVATAASRTLMQQPASTTGSRTSPFGWRIHPVTHRRTMHMGVDLGNRAWAPVYAAASGKVTTSSVGSLNGRFLRIEHGTVGPYRNVSTYYLHLNQARVRVGQYVKKGQLIGYVGSTGRSTGPHLHFGVRVGTRMVDPQVFIGPIASLRNF